jgi:hypothetical protein
MPKYVIEREIPGAGSLTPEQILAISQKSCSVPKNLGPKIQWVESYVTQDKIYCVYIAPMKRLCGNTQNRRLSSEPRVGSEADDRPDVDRSVMLLIVRVPVLRRRRGFVR